MALPPARKARASSAECIVEHLRQLCLAFPEANERVSHGEPTWFAGTGKVFAMLDDHHHGSRHLSVWLPLPRGVQEQLIDKDPERYFRPPYVGVRGWVGVVLDEPDWTDVAALLRDASVFVAARRLVAVLESSAALPAPSKRRGSKKVARAR